MMVRYAGFDAQEIPFIVGYRLGRPRRTSQERACAMFAHGTDTAAIAKKLKVRESRVLRWITQERSKRLGLPDPYQAQP